MAATSTHPGAQREWELSRAAAEDAAMPQGAQTIKNHKALKEQLDDEQQ
jgi:hypothetical protein